MLYGSAPYYFRTFQRLRAFIRLRLFSSLAKNFLSFSKVAPSGLSPSVSGKVRLEPQPININKKIIPIFNGFSVLPAGPTKPKKISGCLTATQPLTKIHLKF